MAGNLLRYSGLITKTRAMSKKLLSKEEQKQLTEVTSVSEAIFFLKSKEGYEDVYNGRDMVWHRGQAEAIIINSLYQDLKKLYQFSDRNQRKALDIIILRYEADLLKYYLERMYQEEKVHLKGHLDDFLVRHIKLPIEELRHAANVQAFRQALKNTPYERVFLKMVQGENNSFGDYAQKIDIYYYTTAYKQALKLEQDDMQSILKDILGTRIDWLNIMWIYRTKRFYKSSSADIYARLIPIFYRLKKEETEQMVLASGVPEMMKILKETGYFKGKEALVKMEDEILYREVIGKMYRNVSRKYPNSIAPVLKYIFDKEQEIERVTTIIEGIRYQISPREIRDLILITE